MSKCKCFDRNLPPDISTLIDTTVNLSLYTCSCNARFVVEEHRRKFEIIGISTPESIDKIKIDGYLCRSNTEKKCDYLFIYKDKKAFNFVELKGKDLDTAVKQLYNTMKLFQAAKILQPNSMVRAFIVTSRYPSNDSTYKKTKVAFEKEFRTFHARLNQKNNSIAYDPETETIR